MNYRETILDITSSKEYLEYNQYHEGNIFGITGIARLEQMHSNFLAWILTSQESHDLGAYPIYQFMQLLIVSKERLINSDCRLNGKHISACSSIKKIICTNSINREKTFVINEKKNSIDILLEVKTEDGIIPIVIENKVDSKEHDKQTNAYYEYAENKYKGKGFLKPIYVYLTPEYNDSIPECKAYISIKYQDIVDYVLEPSLWKCRSDNIKNIIKSYIQSLSYQSDYSKGDRIMAMSSEEREILERFYNNNKSLIVALAEMMADDDDVDPTLKEKFTSMVSSRDYTKYKFNGSIFSKCRLAYAIVEKYIKDFNPKNYEELQNVFTKELQGGSLGVVIRESEIKENQRKNKRYYIEPNDLIKLQDGTVVAVCNQWGVDNIGNIIDVARSLGYEIDKC